MVDSYITTPNKFDKHEMDNMVAQVNFALKSLYKTNANQQITNSPQTSVFYGNMYIYNLGVGPTVSIPKVDTYYQIKTGITGGLTSQFIFQNGNELKCLIAGAYRVIWAMSISTTVNGEEIEGTIMLNGKEQTSLAAHMQVQVSGRPSTITGNGILKLSANDLISTAILNHTSAHDVTIDHMTVIIF